MTPLLHAASTARAATVEGLSGGGVVLVLAPHPDDETLGCGAAIAALIDQGRRAQVIVVTDGSHSHPASHSMPPARPRELRAAEVTRAVNPFCLGFPIAKHPTVTRQSMPQSRASYSTCPHPQRRPGRPGRQSAPGSRAHGTAGRKADLPDLALSLWSYPIWGRFDPVASGLAPDALVQFKTDRWQDRKATAIAAHVSQMNGLISDDPGGFRMTDAHQVHFLTSPEIVLCEKAP